MKKYFAVLFIYAFLLSGTGLFSQENKTDEKAAAEK